MRILHVNDEENIRSALSEVLTHDGHTVTEVTGGKALDVFIDNPFPLVIADSNIIEIDVIELLNTVKRVDRDTEVIITTSAASLDTAISALRNGAYDYFISNIEDVEPVPDIVNRAVEKIQLNRKNRELLEMLRQKNEKLEYDNRNVRALALFDQESGLYNHHYLRERLNVELKRSRRHDCQFSLLCLDLKPFVHYSMRRGGNDAVIHELGNCLKAHHRRTDVVMRSSDDDITLLLTETPKDGALHVVEKVRRIKELLPSLRDNKGSMRGVDVNVGLVTFPEDGDSGVALLKSARQKLFENTSDKRTVE